MFESKSLLQDKVKRKFSVEEGDHISLVNVYNAFIEVSKYNDSKQIDSKHIDIEFCACNVFVRQAPTISI